MALAVPLSRFTSPVGGGSAFFVRQQVSRRFYRGIFRSGGFGGSDWLAEIFAMRKLPVVRLVSARAGFKRLADFEPLVLRAFWFA